MKQNLLYSGKAKSVFQTENPNELIMEFRDDISAFNAIKLSNFQNKGAINNQINAFLMQLLEKNGIATHFIRMLSPTESLVKTMEMIRVECVVRNISAGSLCKRYGISKGMELHPPLFEFFLKDDALGDPMITEDHIRAFHWAREEEIVKMRQLALAVNEILYPLFFEADMLLVDYKLEFGRCHDEILLGDELSPDGCRIWDRETGSVLDKDLFRHDLGDVIAGYGEVARRLHIPITPVAGEIPKWS